MSVKNFHSSVNVIKLHLKTSFKSISRRAFASIERKTTIGFNTMLYKSPHILLF